GGLRGVAAGVFGAGLAQGFAGDGDFGEHGLLLWRKGTRSGGGLDDERVAILRDGESGVLQQAFGGLAGGEIACDGGGASAGDGFGQEEDLQAGLAGEFVEGGRERLGGAASRAWANPWPKTLSRAVRTSAGRRLEGGILKTSARPRAGRKAWNGIGVSW
ncbi:MAG: hypothetical protein LBE85_00150, partial [Candidatus Accumulibacter sp.]|nr:hypothetical protein [Accumulibacter sp.]